MARSDRACRWRSAGHRAMAYYKHRVVVVAPGCGHEVSIPAPNTCRACYYRHLKEFRPTQAKLAAQRDHVLALVKKVSRSIAADRLGVDRESLRIFLEETCGQPRDRSAN